MRKQQRTRILSSTSYSSRPIPLPALVLSFQISSTLSSLLLPPLFFLVYSCSPFPHLSPSLPPLSRIEGFFSPAFLFFYFLLHFSPLLYPPPPHSSLNPPPTPPLQSRWLQGKVLLSPPSLLPSTVRSQQQVVDTCAGSLVISPNNGRPNREPRDSLTERVFMAMVLALFLYSILPFFVCYCVLMRFYVNYW